MHIAINAQLLSSAESYRGAGVSNYSGHLLRALGQVALAGGDDPGGAGPLRVTAYVNEADFSVPGVDCAVTRPGLRRPLRRIAWE